MFVDDSNKVENFARDCALNWINSIHVYYAVQWSVNNAFHIYLDLVCSKIKLANNVKLNYEPWTLLCKVFVIKSPVPCGVSIDLTYFKDTCLKGFCFVIILLEFPRNSTGSNTCFIWAAKSIEKWAQTLQKTRTSAWVYVFLLTMFNLQHQLNHKILLLNPIGKWYTLAWLVFFNRFIRIIITLYNLTKKQMIKSLF